MPVVYPMMFHESEYINQEPFDAAANFGYETTVFLENSNEEFVTWAIVLLIFPGCELLSFCKNKAISNRAAEYVAEYKYDV